MGKEKLAICSNHNVSGFIKNISNEFVFINVKLLSENYIKHS